MNHLRAVNTIKIKPGTHESIRNQVDNALAVYIAEEEIEELINKGEFLMVDMTETTLIEFIKE